MKGEGKLVDAFRGMAGCCRWWVVSLLFFLFSLLFSRYHSTISIHHLLLSSPTGPPKSPSGGFTKFPYINLDHFNLDLICVEDVLCTFRLLVTCHHSVAPEKMEHLLRSPSGSYMHCLRLYKCLSMNTWLGRRAYPQPSGTPGAIVALLNLRQFFSWLSVGFPTALSYVRSYLSTFLVASKLYFSRLDNIGSGIRVTILAPPIPCLTLLWSRGLCIIEVFRV